MQLSCFFTLKRSYQSIKHESQFGQEGEAQSNAPATSARPPPRPASPVASPPAAVKGEATSVLCCSVLSCLITRLHFLVLKGSARTQALAALSPASPLGRGAGDGFRGPHGQAHLVPPGNPPASEPPLPRCGAPGTAPAPLLPEAPYQCPPAPHRSAVRRGVGGARCDVPGIVSHSEARLRADRRLSARPG